MGMSGETKWEHRTFKGLVTPPHRRKRDQTGRSLREICKVTISFHLVDMHLHHSEQEPIESCWAQNGCKAWASMLVYLCTSNHLRSGLSVCSMAFGALRAASSGETQSTERTRAADSQVFLGIYLYANLFCKSILQTIYVVIQNRSAYYIILYISTRTMQIWANLLIVQYHGLKIRQHGCSSWENLAYFPQKKQATHSFFCFFLNMFSTACLLWLWRKHWLDILFGFRNDSKPCFSEPAQCEATLLSTALRWLESLTRIYVSWCQTFAQEPGLLEHVSEKPPFLRGFGSCNKWLGPSNQVVKSFDALQVCLVFILLCVAIGLGAVHHEFMLWLEASWIGPRSSVWLQVGHMLAVQVSKCRGSVGKQEWLWPNALCQWCNQ